MKIRIRAQHLTTGILAGLGLIAGSAAIAADVPVAGLAPYQRPKGAPALNKAPEAARPLHGISQPVPASITAFMKDQGAWYSPFTHPGMPGYYDLRGWHDRKNATPQPTR